MLKKYYKNENSFVEEAKVLTTYLTQKYYNIMLTDFEKVGSYFDSDFLNGYFVAFGAFLLVFFIINMNETPTYHSKTS